MQEITISVPTNRSKLLSLLWLGQRSEDIRIKAVLDKPGASLKILGIFFGKKNHLELHTNIVHRAPNTFSRIIIKGVLDGQATANIEGNIRIEKGAKNADADLKEHTILLSPTARATAIPGLEVLENEVKAGHGATVGRIDEEQLFYIMTRGLSLTEAKQLIIKGFLGSLLEEFPKKEAVKFTKILKL